MCQPYHHHCTGILKKGPVLKELFSQGFAPGESSVTVFFRWLRFAQAKPSAFAVTFHLQHHFTYWDQGIRVAEA